jgi:hypothetical protein
MPRSIIHGDACFAYFNKIRGIPGTNVVVVGSADLCSNVTVSGRLVSMP